VDPVVNANGEFQAMKKRQCLNAQAETHRVAEKKRKIAIKLKDIKLTTLTRKKT
jgi:hypothetical protein